MKTELRKWLAFGAGVGIEIRETGELQVAIARVRPSGAVVLGAATVTDFHSRPAAEWGTELLQFLRKLGFAHVAATVLLPRKDVIVREIALLGVSDSDLESAIALQIDALHPFGEEEVYYSWSRLGKSDSVLIGIARHEVVNRYLTLFAEAGIKTASFTFSAAVLYAAQRMISAAPGQGFLAVYPSEDPAETEVYGESEARPVYSAVLPGNAESAAALAIPELRLDPASALLIPLADLLPKPAVFPASYDPSGEEFSRHVLAYGTALVSACRWFALDANLLPPERRRGSSRVRLIPTFALGAILLMLVGALLAQSKYDDSRYLNLLQTEIRRLEPRAKKIDVLDKQTAIMRARSQSLDEFRRRTKQDIDALQEVTKIIAPPGWVNGFELDRNTIQFGGEVEQAATLLKLLDNSPYFAQSQFTMPITRQGAVGDMFRLKAVRENPSAAPTAVAPGAPAAAPVTAAPAQAAPATPAAQAPNPFSGTAK